MNISQILKQITDEEKTPSVILLVEMIQGQSEEIQRLKDEMARLQKRKGSPRAWKRRSVKATSGNTPSASEEMKSMA